MAGLIRSSAVSALGTGVSRLLGLLREVVLSSWYGAGLETDAFLNAFTVPNILRRFVADEGLTGAIIPELARADEKGDADEARRVASGSLAALLLATGVVTVGGILAAPLLVRLLDWNLVTAPGEFELTVSLTRWLMPFLAFVSVVSWAEGLLNHRGHFFAPKAAPALVSIGTVVAVLFLYSRLERPVDALVIGTLIGGAAQVVVCIPPLVRHWGWIRPDLNEAFRSPEVRRMSRAMGQVMIIGVAAQLNFMVLRQLANALERGALSWFYYAFRITDLAQGIATVAVGSALLPAISRAVHSSDEAEFRDVFGRAVRLTSLVILPATLLTASLARPTVAVLFQRGAFTAHDADATAETLRLLVFFLIPASLIFLIKKAFFALDDRRSLIVVGVLGLSVTGLVGMVTTRLWGLPGLAAALTIATALQLLAYVALLERRLPGGLSPGQLVDPLGRMTLASLGASVAAAALCLAGDWQAGVPLSASVGWWNLGVFSAAVLLAMGVYVEICRRLRVDEVDYVLGVLARRFGRG